MENRRLLTSLLVSIGFTAWVATGCGGTDLECGPETTKVDDECRPAASACGEGTKQVEGKCVLESEPVTCAEGTEPRVGKCVPEVECGPDTEADSTGKCVPTNETVACGANTVRDGDECVSEVECGPETMPDANGRCVPSYESICGENTVREGNECVADGVDCGEGLTEKDGVCTAVKFRLTEIETSGEVVADGSGLELKVHWEGNPTWPLKLHDLIAGDCPKETACVVADDPIEITEEQNPIVFEDVYACTSGAIGVDFTRALYLEDSEGRESNTRVFTWTCRDA